MSQGLCTVFRLNPSLMLLIKILSTGNVEKRLEEMESNSLET